MKYFTVEELSRSNVAQMKGIANVPSPQHVANMNRLVEITLDQARELYGKPITVNSGYRSKELDVAVGGALRSYHLEGRAADITTGTVAGNRRLFEILSELPHVELIWEKGGSWIHVAL